MVSISSSWICCICTSIPFRSHWAHQWSICSPIHMNTHYWISEHHLGWLFWNLLWIDSVKLWIKFVPTGTPPDPLPKFGIKPISTPPLTKFVPGATIVSIPMVVMITLNDWITYVPASYLRISITVAFETFGEVELIRVWRCSILWLPIGVICGVECGCEYTFGALLLNWMDGWIDRLYGPNWPLNSMFLNLFWITKILGS